jgi:hypothetical protein
MSERNQYFINELRPIINSSNLLLGRDDEKNKVWLYAREWDDATVIEVIRVFHKYRRHFIFTTWGGLKLPCIMSA